MKLLRNRRGLGLLPALLVGLMTVPVWAALVWAVPQGEGDPRGLAARIIARPFSEGGRVETLRVEFDKPVTGPVRLEVYTFHYPMFPYLAPPQDMWRHERQMAHMQDVLTGRTPRYEPDPTDPRVARILEVSSREHVALEPAPDGSYSAAWKASHGRIFFRVAVGEEALEPLASMRVHCTYPDLRTVERLKETIGLMHLPLERGHGEVVARVYEQMAASYRVGHGLRFMLDHHGFETAAADRLIARLGEQVHALDREAALLTLEAFQSVVTERQSDFVDVEVQADASGLRVTLRDPINGFDFAADVGTRVYLKAGPLRSDAEVHKAIMDLTAQGAAQDAAVHEAAAHQAMMAAGPSALLNGAIALLREEGGFRLPAGEVPVGPGERGTLIVLYGTDGAYHFTQQVVLPGA